MFAYKKTGAGKLLLLWLLFVVFTVQAAAPVITEGSISVVSMDEDGSPVGFSLNLHATDEDGESLSWSINTPANHGTAIATGTGLSKIIGYTPTLNYNGTDSFIVQVSDGFEAAFHVVNISINPQNDAPVVTEGSTSAVTIDEDNSPIAFSLSLNATDADGNALIWIFSSLASHGTAYISGSSLKKDIGYTPNENYNGHDTFTVQLSDGIATANHQVNVTINPQNDAPDIISAAVTEATEDAVYSYAVAATDIDVTDSLSFNAPILPAWLSMNDTTGVLNGIPGDADVGVHAVTVRVNDGIANKDQSFIISVVNVNDAPSGTVVIAGIATEGKTLSVSNDLMDADGLGTISYQWRRGDITISGATGSSYTLGEADVGNALTVTASYIDAQGTHESITSAATGPVIGDLDADGFGDDVDPDIDGDGMDNVYETGYGFDSYNPADAELDADGDGISNLDEFKLGSNPTLDEAPPQIIAPADVTIDSTGLYTLVDFGEATAFDIVDGIVTAVSNLDNYLSPGTHEVVWSATDAAANVGTATQTINVIPMVEFSIDQVSVEGNTVDVKVVMNGAAVTYPVLVPYVVSGTASPGSDHDLADGIITINSDSEALLSFNIMNDEQSDADENIIISMESPGNAVMGPHDVHTITIVEGNMAPQVILRAVQDQKTTRIISQVNGMVTVVANVTDANNDDVHSYNWNGTDNALLDTDTANDTFSFNPVTIAPGLYTLRLNVSDGLESEEAELALNVVSSAPLLTTADSDGDGINDVVEGYGDADNDGVPDFLDAVAMPNLLQAQSASSDQYLMATEPGLALALGLVAFQSNLGQAVITSADIVQYSDWPVDELPNVGGLFDFVISGLAEAGQSVLIVLPQLSAIPIDAGFRKLMPTGWQDFVENDNNVISSAPAEAAYCPPPGDILYTQGLTEGHWCVQLFIEDGGPNDADLKPNKRVLDPGGLVELQNITVSVYSSGGVMYSLLFILVFWRLWFRFWTRKKVGGDK